MTTIVDICNRALLEIGLQKVISSLAQDSAEARACNTFINIVRDDLLRRAPWDCAIKTANLTYITSVPGTPENTSPATTLWQPGQPRPPWAYEYQYPVDCLLACWMIPSTQFGFSGGVPITTAVTGGASTLWNGAPITFKVATDTFYPVTAVAIANGGTQYSIGDIITLAGYPQGSSPIGAPAQLQVLAVGAGNAVTSVALISQMPNTATPLGGSYFAPQANPVAQGSVVSGGPVPGGGTGVGATFNLTFGTPQPQRVVLTNQEFATMVYVAQTTDPDLWDPLFQDALQQVLSSRLLMSLVGPKSRAFANQFITSANAKIEEARRQDGNEGLSINDVTPDWIRIRGVWWSDNLQSGPYAGFDWGGWLPSY